eukprot:PLAT10995.1.p1 GENE.PLAT10995.1~~PLAT10995.1.p1  ORF type:complete len:618 (+),score=372.84 PLAT10995.1:22-1854(+)
MADEGKKVDDRADGKDDAASDDKQPQSALPSAEQLAAGRPVQVVTVHADGQRFELQEAALAAVLQQVPADMKVGILSVVGAFRMGKSFLLDFFLRFLEVEAAGDGDVVADGMEWMTAHGDKLQGQAGAGAAADGVADFHGFGWRGGRERCTTGIWLWSRPYIRTAADGEQMALLVMDTQGMWDSKTGQMLTASIFGLSTLLSSYQIYNLSRQLQEDDLQHLSLYSEYGRVALEAEEEDGSEDSIEADLRAKLKAVEAEEGSSVAAADAAAKAAAEESKVEEALLDAPRPFQLLEFLVRDCSFLDGGIDDPEGMLAEMEAYLSEKLAQRRTDDLSATREQIEGCFETLRCFLMVHPGLEVAEDKSYDGSIATIRDKFRGQLNFYIRRVLSTVDRKRIHGRMVTADELGNYIRAYVHIFCQSDAMPEAKTLLAATADAHSRNAKDSALKTYRREMDRMLRRKTFILPSKLDRMHHMVCQAALRKFHTMATMGPRSLRHEMAADLLTDMQEQLTYYERLNASREALRTMWGTGTIPAMLIFALVCYVLRIVTDVSCSGWSSTCASAANFFGQIYGAIFVMVILVFMVSGTDTMNQVRALWTALTTMSAKQKRD